MYTNVRITRNKYKLQFIIQNKCVTHRESIIYKWDLWFFTSNYNAVDSGRNQSVDIYINILSVCKRGLSGLPVYRAGYN